MPAMHEIVLVVHVRIGLAFERDMRVGTPLHGQADKPFYHIPEVETYEAQLYHLRRMYALVLNEVARNERTLTAEEQSEYVDGIVLPRWQQAIMYDFHCLRLTI